MSEDQKDNRSDFPGCVAVSIVIVNWNSVAFVRRAVTAIRRWVSNVDYEIIVVDGGSHDSCGRVMAAEFPDVSFVQSEHNIGFGRANNLGAKHARGRCLLLLNPDTELRENSVLTLLRSLESLPGAGAVGCRLLNEDGTLQTACVQAFPTIFNQIIDAEFLRRRFPRWKRWGIGAFCSTAPSVVEVISGACILVKKEVFDMVGGFSPCYFMYGEDVDLCFKIKQAGYAVYHVPQTSLVHFGGGSADKTPGNFSSVMMRESTYRYLRRNRGVFTAVGYRTALAPVALVRVLLILALLLFPRNEVVRNGTASLRKWGAILRWCLGLEYRIVAQADRSLIKECVTTVADGA